MSKTVKHKNIFQSSRKSIVLTATLLILGFAALSPEPIFGQDKNAAAGTARVKSGTPKDSRVEKRNKAISKPQTDEQARDSATATAATITPNKTASTTRMTVKTGDIPPLLTLAVGQVTTIKLPEAPLYIAGDRLGLNITESNENSINKYVYIIPIKSGIRRNLVIELASGKIEFELSSIGVEAGKSAAFTREVEVKNASEEKRSVDLEREIIALKAHLIEKEKEISGTPDRTAAAVFAAQLGELKIQTAILLEMAKTKKERSAQSAKKDWEISELYSSKAIAGDRMMSIYEISYRGKNADGGKLLDVKSDGGARIFWRADEFKQKGAADGEGLTLKRGDKIRIAVVEFTDPKKSRGLVFVSDGETVKF